MPGILPMKVIKVGTSSQSRIAQACDRCRSKKIRCDGIRPTCTQCANVGFECRTSDKLSRRAFPRGYTESLEERVRALETEIRELKDLLDEKDEKIDLLSRMHGNRQPSLSHVVAPVVTTPPDSSSDTHTPPREDTFRLQASPLLLGVENSDSYFMGSSSGRAFIEGFKRRLQENGKPCGDFNPEAFLHIQGCRPLVLNLDTKNLRIPPRLFTDRCVNVYFQEWAPLFPTLHKPSFLRLYEDFVADPEKIRNSEKIAQLYLVFSIAALSREQADVEHIAACEHHWQKHLDAVIMDSTMGTLQCLVLAILYCMVRADYKRLQHYKGIAIGLSHRLGLHQSQKRFSFGTLTTETRKRVFWTLYTLDCFSAAMLGLPKVVREDDIHTEYPADTDDEYVTEKGFQPTLPGEYTRLSSALALFRVSRILGQVLEKVYPAATTHELSLQLLSSLDGELSEWHDTLPAHLKLNFVQDKPSTDITGSRSPILALAFYYIRTLIHRPAVGSSLGSKAVPSLLIVSESSKHIVQIIQLLEERSMSFSFCLNKADVLVICAITLLYHSIELTPESKIMKDVERLSTAVLATLEQLGASGTHALKRVAALLVPGEQQGKQGTRRDSSDSPLAKSMAAPPPRPSLSLKFSRKKSPHAISHHVSATMSETDLLSEQEKIRRRSVAAAQLTDSATTTNRFARPQSRASFDQRSLEQPPRRDHRFSLSQIQQSMMRRVRPNLDYLSFNTSPTESQPPSPPLNRSVSAMQLPQSHATAMYTTHHQHAAPKPASGGSGVSSMAEWEALVGSMDHGNLYHAIYGGPGTLNLTEPTATTTTPTSATTTGTRFGDWSPDSWDLSGFQLGDVTPDHAHAHAIAVTSSSSRSLPSISDESLSSGDDLAASDLYVGLHGVELGGGGEDFGHHKIALQPSRSSQDSGELVHLDGLDIPLGAEFAY